MEIAFFKPLRCDYMIALNIQIPTNLNQLETQDLFEMANLRQTSTGLPMVIWVSERGYAQHRPRIKVATSHSHKIDISNSVSVSITEPPEIMAGTGLSQTDLKLVQEYILLNKKALLEYWQGEIDTLELLEKLQKI